MSSDLTKKATLAVFSEAQAAALEIPGWVADALEVLGRKNAAHPMDKIEARRYLFCFVGLTERQTLELVTALDMGGVFRPDPAEVVKRRDLMFPPAAPTGVPLGVLPGDAAAYQPVNRDLLGLPSANNGPERQKFRAKLRQLSCRMGVESSGRSASPADLAPPDPDELARAKQRMRDRAREAGLLA